MGSYLFIASPVLGSFGFSNTYSYSVKHSCQNHSGCVVCPVLLLCRLSLYMSQFHLKTPQKLTCIMDVSYKSPELSQWTDVCGMGLLWLLCLLKWSKSASLRGDVCFWSFASSMSYPKGQWMTLCPLECAWARVYVYPACLLGFKLMLFGGGYMILHCLECAIQAPLALNSLLVETVNLTLYILLPSDQCQ